MVIYFLDSMFSLLLIFKKGRGDYEMNPSFPCYSKTCPLLFKGIIKSSLSYSQKLERHQNILWFPFIKELFLISVFELITKMYSLVIKQFCCLQFYCSYSKKDDLTDHKFFHYGNLVTSCCYKRK